ncbi:MAG TPA: CMD domain protein, partial [Dehalococcoidia bacterium]
MTQPDTISAGVSQSDLLNSLLGIDQGSALAQLRARRPEATGHTQGSYRALFTDPSAVPVSRTERFATALRVASLHREPTLAEHYTAQLRATPGGSEQLIADLLTGPEAADLPARLRAMLAHADLLVVRPAAATPADLQALQAVGLSDAEIVTVSQLIAFVSFQVRVLIGLSLLRGDERPAPASQVGPRDARTAGFTQEQIG